jgi:hypothetical protein
MDAECHHSRDLRRPVRAFFVITDRDWLDSEDGRDQGREKAQRAASLSGKDRLQCRSLLLIDPLVEVDRRRPVPFPHRSGRPEGQGHVQVIQADAIIAALIDMEGHSDLAGSLSGLGGQRGS